MVTRTAFRGCPILSGSQGPQLICEVQRSTFNVDQLLRTGNDGMYENPQVTSRDGRPDLIFSRYSGPGPED